MALLFFSNLEMKKTDANWSQRFPWQHKTFSSCIIYPNHRKYKISENMDNYNCLVIIMTVQVTELLAITGKSLKSGTAAQNCS